MYYAISLTDSYKKLYHSVSEFVERVGDTDKEFEVLARLVLAKDSYSRRAYRVFCLPEKEGANGLSASDVAKLRDANHKEVIEYLCEYGADKSEFIRLCAKINPFWSLVKTLRTEETKKVVKRLAATKYLQTYKE